MNKNENSLINSSSGTKLWLYKMNNNKYISTKSEIEIAKNLSKNKSREYLESRALIRQSLSNLFNLDPLDIPIKSIPNKPILLDPKMGYVNISHCNDALIIGWSISKIGVDIERIDRDFNYKDLAKRYLFRNNIEKNKKLSKLDVLNRWCGIESAIKWSEGSIAKNIGDWNYNFEEKQLFNNKENFNLDIIQFYFKKWTISLAQKNFGIFFEPIICHK